MNKFQISVDGRSFPRVSSHPLYQYIYFVIPTYFTNTGCDRNGFKLSPRHTNVIGHFNVLSSELKPGIKKKSNRAGN